MSAWAALAVGIAVYDTWLIRTGRDTLSREYATAVREHPVAVALGTGYLLAHLCGVLPREVDAFYGYGAGSRHLLAGG